MQHKKTLSLLFVFIIGFPVKSANLQQHVVMLEQELQWARLKIQALTEELRLERIKRYGHKSETLSALQLELLDEEPGVTETGVGPGTEGLRCGPEHG